MEGSDALLYMNRRVVEEGARVDCVVVCVCACACVRVLVCLVTRFNAVIPKGRHMRARGKGRIPVGAHHSPPSVSSSSID